MYQYPPSNDPPQQKEVIGGGATVEECLESLADGVLQIVLFKVEVDENKSYLIDLDVQPLLAAINFLLDLAKRKAAKWQETDEKDNKEKMLESCQIVGEESVKIHQSLAKLKENRFDKEAKKILLISCRLVVQEIVKLLSISDRYDIRKVIRAANATRREHESLHDILSVKDPQSFIQEAIRNYIYYTVTLGKTVQGRINYIADPIFKRRLEDQKYVLQKEPENFIKLTAALASQPGNKAIYSEHQALYYKIDYAIEEIINVVKLSSSEMFSGIETQLAPFDPEDDNMGISHQAKGSAAGSAMVAHVSNAMEFGNQAEAMSATQEYTAQIAQQVEYAQQVAAQSPQKAAQIAQVIESIHSAQKAIIEEPGAQIDTAMRALVANAQNLLDLTSELPQTSQALQAGQALNCLHVLGLAATDPEMRVAALTNAKDALTAIKEQIALAQHYANGECNDPVQKAHIFGQCNEVQSAMSALLPAMRAFLANPEDLAAKTAFLDALHAAQVACSGLAASVNPSRAQSQLLPSQDLIAHSVPELENNLNSLRRALVNGDQNGIAIGVRGISEGLSNKIQLAKALAQKPYLDPKIKDSLLKSAQDLTNTMLALVNATKSARSTGNLDEFDTTAEQCKKGLQALVDAGTQGEDNVLREYQAVMNAVPELEHAVNSKDSEQAMRALQQVVSSATKQILAFRQNPISSSSSSKEEFLKCAKSAASALKLLKEIVSNSPTTNSPEFLKSLEEIKNICKDMASKSCYSRSLMLLEKKIIQNASNIEALLINLDNSMRKGINEEAKLISRSISAKLLKQSMIIDHVRHVRKEKDLDKSILKKLSQKLHSTAKDFGLKENFCDPKSQEEVREFTHIVDDTNQQVLSICLKLKPLLIGVVSYLFDSFSRLLNQSTPFNVVSQQPEFSSIIDHLTRESILSKAIGRKIEEPKKRDILKAVQEVVPLYKEKIPTCFSDLASDSQNPTKGERLRTQLDQGQSKSVKLESAVMPTVYERIQLNGETIDEFIKGLKESLKKASDSLYTPQSLDQLNDLDLRTKRQSFFTSEELIKLSIDTNQKDQLNSAKDELLNEAWSLYEQATSLLNQQLESSELNKHIPSLIEHFEKISQANQVIMKISKEISLEEASIDNGGAKDQLRAAARMIQAKTNNLDSLSGSSHPIKAQIYQLIQKIGEEMRKLSTDPNKSSSENKRSMINAARDITSLVSGVLQQVKVLSETITNPRAKDELLSMVQAARNFSVQLKILSAVKSSATDDEEEDPAAESQLSTCSKGLANSLVKCVDMTEIAQLIHH